MSAPIISVEKLAKSYLVGHQAEETVGRYQTFRETWERGVRNAGRKAFDMMRGRQIIQGDTVEEFWALKDVTFDVQQGEVLGIIGRNGAGKSTLLKILSRITEPSAGRITLRGRVASLLEVGTGFHPELTGRENVYLNGAILGMTRAEIRRKFDEIVAFADVEKFLDTPVKRYSSGMYVRLAFAVAAHLEPEILIVDEVLSVGDAEFQKKSLGKMSEVAGGGRTVLFVSHNLASIQALCTRGLLLRDGVIAIAGAPIEVVEAYISRSQIMTSFRRPPAPSSKPLLVSASWLKDHDIHEAKSRITIELTISTPYRTDLGVDVRLKDRYLNPVGFGSLGGLELRRPVCVEKGFNTVMVGLDAGSLAVGEYLLSVDLTNPCVEYYDRAEDCIIVEVNGNHIVGAKRDFEQRWGYGSNLIPLSLESSGDHPGPEKRNTSLSR
jgi:ABC-type polysaccharide/polyol phosphate transport system ATPase subunit